MNPIRQNTLRISYGIAAAIAIAAIGETAIRRSISLPTLTEILIFITKAVCATIVVCVGHIQIVRLERRGWSYPVFAARDHHSSFVEGHEESWSPSTPTSPGVRPTQELAQSTRRDMETVAGLAQSPQPAIWNPQASAFRSPRPTHHSGILGPSPHPHGFFHAENDASRPLQINPEQQLTLRSPEPPTPAAHPRRFGYNGTPAPAGFKHFSGLGFAENMDKMRSLNLSRAFAKIEENVESGDSTRSEVNTESGEGDFIDPK